MIQAVLFDMDGTLIDTEKYYRIFWPKALAACGYTMTDEQALTMRSLGRPFAPRQLKDWYGEDFDYYVVRDKRKEMMEETLDRDGIKCKPGAVELLENSSRLLGETQENKAKRNCHCAAVWVDLGDTGNSQRKGRRFASRLGS